MSDRTHFLDALHFRLFRWLERDVGRRSGWQALEGGQVAITTDIGSERDENQDRAVVLRSSAPDGTEYLLAIVCDGMGGMRDGRLCASIAASGVVVAFLRSQAVALRERLVNAAQSANLSVHQKYGGKGGATLSAVCISSSGETCGLNVGDSRIYGSTSRRISALSVDDTIAGQIGREGGGAEANSLLQFIGIGTDIDPHIVEIPTDLQWIVITTDGAHCIPPDALLLLASRAQTAEELSRRVVQSAQWMGSRDNGTVACVRVPLGVLSASIERSVRLVDPCGEIHLLNPTDNRPAYKTDATLLPDSSRSPASPSESVALESIQSDRPRGRKRRADKSKTAHPRLLPDQRPENRRKLSRSRRLPRVSSHALRTIGEMPFNLPLRYQPKATIGAGGMGVVQLYRDTSLDRDVAVNFTQRLDNIDRVYDELRALQ